MTTAILKDAEQRMTNGIEALNRELAKLRAGRANPAMLDRVMVEYYGTETPLNQLATISVPEGRQLLIQPFDKSSIAEIERAILKADLGLTPSNDGSVVRITIPALTEERRKELVRIVRRSAEDAKVSVRNIRRDANDELRKMEKNGELTEDDLRRQTDQVQSITDNFIAQIDNVCENKEQEIMEV